MKYNQIHKQIILICKSIWFLWDSMCAVWASWLDFVGISFERWSERLRPRERERKSSIALQEKNYWKTKIWDDLLLIYRFGVKINTNLNVINCIGCTFFRIELASSRMFYENWDIFEKKDMSSRWKIIKKTNSEFLLFWMENKRLKKQIRWRKVWKWCLVFVIWTNNKLIYSQVTIGIVLF